MKKTTKTTETKSLYKVSIKILGKEYSSTGKTLLEALNNLKFQGTARGVCILSVEKGKDKKDRILRGQQVARLFSESKLMKEIAIKNVSLLFGL